MDLIFLYGLPGSGKLTIAKELVKRQPELKLFHNQMTVDIISPIIPFPHPRGFKLSEQYRLLMIDACLDLDISLVMTHVYAVTEDDAYINKVIDLIDQKGGKAFFIHLVCDRETVFQRIQNPDRKNHRKVMNPAKLQTSLERWDLESPINFVDNLEIDTVTHTVTESAEIILNHYYNNQ